MSVVAEVTEGSSTPGESLDSDDLRGLHKNPLPLPPDRGSVTVLPHPLSEERLGWVSEVMKVVFNQTVHWKEEGDFTEVIDV